MHVNDFFPVCGRRLRFVLQSDCGRTVFLRFVADLELEFGVLLLQATPKALVVVIPILLAPRQEVGTVCGS